MVKIYTNENNPATLKLIISSLFANNPPEVVTVGLQDKNLADPKHLPYAVVADDRVLFIPNAAARYLFGVEETLELQVNEWLEFESVVLSSVVAYYGSGIKNDRVTDGVTRCLKKLDSALANTEFLVDNRITVADVVIFSCLYPLYNDSVLKQTLEPYLKVLSWIKRVEEINNVQTALSKYKISGASAYSSLLSGAKYSGMAPAVVQNVNVSPQHTVEVAVSPEELELAKKAWQKDVGSLPQVKQIVKPVLPIAGEKNVLITSALPYVNNVPHLGNIIGCVLSADVFARFSRMCNNNTLFICGTDEYGTATETKALEEGLSCQEICDKYFKIHSEIYKWFNISFDHFGRTSTPQQAELCQDLFLTLNHNGFMFTEPVEQLHCETCDRYLADRFVEGGCPHPGCNYMDARGDQCDSCGKLVNAVELKNPRCKICSSTPKLKRSKQFFIDLPKLEPLLLHWMKKVSPGWSNNAQVIGKAWLREGLKPRCITRDLKWGVPVPLDGYRDKVFYVWFDAPIGYMSISKAYTDQWEKWWQPAPGVDVTFYQFMAKDNVPFHAVMFPATLLGANKGYTTVSHIMATEYLNYEDGKFSKSRGVGVFGNDAQNTGIPSDVWRFYLLYVRPESQDSSFSWADLATKNNSELLNNLGNFINRALMFAKNSFKSTVPLMKPTEEDYTLLALCTREYKGYVASLEKAKLRDGIRHIFAISRHGNQYMQSTQPWVLLKGTEGDKERAATVIGICCNIACLLATLLHPYMPDTSATLLRQLNTTISPITPTNVEIITYLRPGHKMNDPAPLFTKIEPARVEELKKLFAGKQSENGKSKEGDGDVEALRAAVAKQGDKVRQLKSSGKGKDVWQPEVKILLELKAKLEVAEKVALTIPNGVPVQNGVPATVDLNLAKQLEEEVAKQGAVVRKLKESGQEKSVWQPEVDKLLQLKNKLATASGTSTEQKPKKKGKK